MNRVRRGDRAGFTTAPNQVVCCCCKDGRMMERRFHTNLSFEECLARLAATGWSGEPKPGRWQPTTADRDVFRKVEGNCFQLADRRMQASGPEEFYQVFQGSLREQDQGTLITGSYHSTSHGVANLPPRACYALRTLPDEAQTGAMAGFPLLSSRWLAPLGGGASPTRWCPPPLLQPFLPGRGAREAIVHPFLPPSGGR